MHVALSRCTDRSSTFFVTDELAEPTEDLPVRQIDRMRRLYGEAQKQRPFQTVAIGVLPDHVHALWSLPDGDRDFASRWSMITASFSRGLPPAAPRSASQAARREKGIWRRRYREHTIRDDADLERHVDDIHFNPVKHGHVSAVRDWPSSSFHRWVERGISPLDWGGDVVGFEGRFGE